MKKFSLFILVGLLILFLTGCSQLQTQTTFDIDKDGKMDIEIVLRADKTFAGNQAKAFVWGLTNSIPELQNNYTLTETTKTIDYSDYLYYTFKNKEKISADNHENITFKQEDGSYQFELRIPALLEEVSESDKDTRAYQISVTLPRDVDMANSTEVEGNKATWVIYYHDLTSETTLKAFTQ